MKKLLTALTTVTLLVPVSLTIVACGVKPESKVILAMPQETVGSSSLDKQGAYKDLVSEFNELHKAEIEAGTMVEIEARWEKSGNISKDIAAGANLPDLYVFYGDAVSSFVYSNAKEEVRDMEASLKGSAADGEAKYNEFSNSLITDTYLKEGKYNEKQIVLPFGKSVDYSIINVRLLADLQETLLGQSSIRTTFNSYNKNQRSLTLGNYTNLTEGSYFNNAKADEIYLNLDPSLPAAFSKIIEDASAATESNIEPIRAIFKDPENIKTLTKVVEALYVGGAIDYSSSALYKSVDANKNFKDDDQKKAALKTLTDLSNASNHYAFSIDSLENKFFMDWAAQPENEAANGLIDITDPNNNFLYNSQIKVDEKGNVTGTDFEINQSSSAFKATTDLLDFFKGEVNDKLTGTSLEPWKGTFMTKYSTTGGSVYTSKSFVNGTTLVGSGSSAGAYNYTSASMRYTTGEGEKEKSNSGYLVSNADLLTTSTIGNEKDTFMSQGPGIAGFKSTGPNAAEKETTVTEFLNYIMQPKQAAQFALKTNYMPPTKEALSIFENYINGTYNNKDAFAFEANKKALAAEVAENDTTNNTFDTDADTTDEVEKLSYLFNTITPKNVDGHITWSVDDVSTNNQARIDTLNSVYDNLTDSTTQNANEKRFEEFFVPLADASDASKANSRAAASSINAGFIDDFLTKIANNTQDSNEPILVASTPSPIGDQFRSAVKESYAEKQSQSVMYLKDANFSDFLNEAQAGKINQTILAYYIQQQSGGDVLKNINIKYKK